MKICIDKYPMGSFPYQKSPGKHFDTALYENLSVLAERIVDDMTFLGIISSSTLEVGTGKSCFATQIGEAWQELMKNIHGIDLPYGIENIAFKPTELIEKSFNVPKHSFVLLDEWEDTNYWSKLGITFRNFFRKCRQLNLFMIAIIPNFFQLPLGYAIGRSVFFIDVKFEERFERGHFSFYSFEKKKDLYNLGKKYHDYKVVSPDFSGYFGKGYGIDENTYRKAKYADMIEEVKEKKIDEREIKIKLFKQLHHNLPEITIKRLAEGFMIHPNTATLWLSNNNIDDNQRDKVTIPPHQSYDIYPVNKPLFVGANQNGTD